LAWAELTRRLPVGKKVMHSNLILSVGSKGRAYYGERGINAYVDHDPLGVPLN
jgi:hypothetical protein